jgi:transcriptional regulator with XRE-family HTH domain
MKRIQLGRRSPTVVTLWHIAEALGVKLQLFFREKKSRHRPHRPAPP